MDSTAVDYRAQAKQVIAENPSSKRGSCGWWLDLLEKALEREDALIAQLQRRSTYEATSDEIRAACDALVRAVRHEAYEEALELLAGRPMSVSAEEAIKKFLAEGGA